MTNRLNGSTWRIGMLAGLGALLAMPGRVDAGGADGRPNILFIMSDVHAYQAISACGSNRNQTPHIDRILDRLRGELEVPPLERPALLALSGRVFD